MKLEQENQEFFLSSLQILGQITKDNCKWLPLVHGEKLASWKTLAATMEFGGWGENTEKNLALPVSY